MRERLADQRGLAFHPTRGVPFGASAVSAARLSIYLSVCLSIYLARALIALGLEGREGVVTLRTANLLPEHLVTNSG